MIWITSESDLIFAGKTGLYFYATWMPYHQKMMVMIDKMSKKDSDISYHAIDVDHYKSLCKRFSVESIPTVIYFNDQREVGRINGYVLTKAFMSTTQMIYNT